MIQQKAIEVGMFFPLRKYRATRSRVLLALVGMLIICPSAWGQTDRGAVLGQITDPTGAVIPQAQIQLTSEGTSLSLSTVSDGSGNYMFPAVHIGKYTLTAEAKGFAKQTQLHLVVDVQQQATVNFVLQPGALVQSIDVTATQPVLQTQDASVGQVVESHTIQALPLNGRNYTFLAQLSAGVTTGQQDTRHESAHGRFTVDGVRATENSYILDGMDNNSSIISRTNGKDYVMLGPVDGLLEFKVQTNDYSAVFGKADGAVLPR